MNNRKNAKADLRSYYTIFLQIGLVLSLLIFIAATKIDIHSEEPQEYVANEQEVIEVDEIIRTEQVEVVEPPPVMPSPVEVPNDEVIEDLDLNISADLDFGNTLSLPPPPDQDDDEPAFYMAVEHQPELIGGMEALHQEINYPDIARRQGIEGTVIVQFIVSEAGVVTDPKVIKSLHPACDQEALRAISQMKFRPGLQQGRPVPVQFNIPIVFRLGN